MPQYKALAFSQPVRKELMKDSAESPSLTSATELQNLGLIESLSLFDIEGLGVRKPYEGIFAVAYNILTRGFPTIASPNTEKLLAQLGATIASDKTGITEYQLQEGIEPAKFIAQVRDALHLVLPELEADKLEISGTKLGSKFEKAFLKDYIGAEDGHIRQLSSRQRPRALLGVDTTLVPAVDFCIEIPYLKERVADEAFGKQRKIRFVENVVVEVDGAKYHVQDIDDIKDAQLSAEGVPTIHIRERSAGQDTAEFLKRINALPFVQKVKSIYKGETKIPPVAQLHALLPTAIVRMQLAFLEWMQTLRVKNSELRIAVLEQDIPAAQIAFDELFHLLNLLQEASNAPFVRSIKLEVFSNNHFHTSNFQSKARPFDQFAAEDFDAVFDFSMLQRVDVFESPIKGKGFITIRSAHYKEPRIADKLKVANPIKYRTPIATEVDGQIKEQETVVDILAELLEILFRKKKFRDGQLPILARALQQKSVIGLLPTGGGKSLTYQFAALLQPGVTMVVDPIKSLMVDQHRGLMEIGITRSCFINSVLTAREKRFKQQEMAKGAFQFVFISPERLVIEEFRDTLAQTAENKVFFSYCVIDEVHCLSEWGHDFRTPYLHLGINARKFCKTITGVELPLFGLTATASFDVLADIERELEIDKADGNALVRYENTVRNEIFFKVQECTTDLGAGEILTEKKLKQHTAFSKRSALRDAIEQKEQLLLPYKNELVLKEKVLPTAYRDYEPDFIRLAETEEKYVGKRGEHLMKEHDLPLHRTDTNLYNHGSIVFAPHRESDLGVYTIYNNWDSEAETKGYFMGSGDSKGKDDIDHDEASFRHMDAFIAGKSSLMFATKAFGMGIDKPDVRFTYHLNISNSIESFVQEAGRAARDGKISLSTVFFNTQNFEQEGNLDRYRELSTGTVFPDREVWEFFHRMTFPGPTKERVILDELLHRISYPRVPLLKILLERYCALKGILDMTAKGWVKDDRTPRLYIKQSGIDLGYLEVQTLAITNITGNTILEELTSFLVKELRAKGATNFWQKLNQITAASEPTLGIEDLLNEKERVNLLIPFSNAYYAIKDPVNKAPVISLEFKGKILECNIFEALIREGIYDRGTIDLRVQSSLEKRHSFHDFISGFINSRHPTLQDRLKSNAELENAFSSARDASDTAKAIYRLTTLGIVDDYTIDYQNKCFKLTCSRKKQGDYFNSLEEVMTRYISSKDASTNIEQYKESHKHSGLSEMQFCLDRLTDFAYDRIVQKRQMALNDVMSLCRQALTVTDPIEQSEKVKSEIYYYFNAKYSRPENEAKFKNGTSLEACLTSEKDNDFQQVVWKYIDLLDEDVTGSFKNNLKHLRGAAQRTITSTPDFKAAYFLRAYCLIVQSGETKSLLEDAMRDLEIGFQKISTELSTQKLTAFVEKFKEKIRTKEPDLQLEEIFSNIDDMLILAAQNTWLDKFTSHILKTV